MNSSHEKKRARDLQAITGMPYQAAHRAVVNGTEREASVRSGFTASDFVTPREVRIFYNINLPGVIDCATGRHLMHQDGFGQCAGCGAYMEERFDSDGNSYEAIIDEDEFFELCIKTRMYSNWAPPLDRLDGESQYSYFRRNWRPAEEDEWVAAGWWEKGQTGLADFGPTTAAALEWNWT